jgi:hypothetical protein
MQNYEENSLNKNMVYTNNYLRSNIPIGKKTSSGFYPDNLGFQQQSSQSGQKYSLNRSLSSGLPSSIEKNIKPFTFE